jgi:hypothetical protein
MFSLDSDPTPEDAAVLNAMKSHHFAVMGWQRTFWDFFVGFGLAVTVFFSPPKRAALGALTTVRPRLAQPMIASFFVAWIGLLILDRLFFFPAPLVASMLITLLIGAAWIVNRKTSQKLPAVASTNPTEAVN